MPIDIWIGLGGVAIALLALGAAAGTFAAIEERKLDRREAYAIAFITHNASWMSAGSFLGLLVVASQGRLDNAIQSATGGISAWGAVSAICFILIVREVSLSVYRAIELSRINQRPRSFARLILLYYIPSVFVAWLQVKNISWNDPLYVLIAVGIFGYAAIGQFALIADILARNIRKQRSSRSWMLNRRRARRQNRKLDPSATQGHAN